MSYYTEKTTCLPPRPLILDVTMTHGHYGRKTLFANGNLTHTISSNDAPQTDGALKNVDRKKYSITVSFTPISWNRLCLCPEESDQFRFLRTDFLANLKVSVGLILDKTSVTRITIPLGLSTWSFIHLHHFFRSRRTLSPLLTPSLVLYLERSGKGTHVVCSFFKLHRLYCASHG